MFNLGYMHEHGLGMKRDIHLAKRFYDMASETSVDAHIPVSIALAKLGVVFSAEYLEEIYTDFRSNMWKYINLTYHFGQFWDLYFTAFLAGILGLFLIARYQQL